MFQRSEKYIPIGRYLLKNKKAKKYQKYGKEVKDIAANAHIISRRGGVPDRIVEGDKIEIPFFDIACHPEARIDDNINRKDMIQKSKTAIEKIEDTEIICDINAAARPTQTVTYNGELNLATLNYGFSLLESHNVKVKNIIMHPMQYAELRLAGLVKMGLFQKIKRFFFNTQGEIYGANIYVSHRVYEGKTYLLSDPNLLGVFYSKKIRHLTCNNPKELRRGLISFKSIGVAVLNDWCVVKLEGSIQVLLSDPPKTESKNPLTNNVSDDKKESSVPPWPKGFSGCTGGECSEKKEISNDSKSSNEKPIPTIKREKDPVC